jgi:hypothetical protein
MHGPPKDRLDSIPIPGLQGCVVQARKIAAARPLLCVFGHYHVSNGVERVTWGNGTDGVAAARNITKEKGERSAEYDFSRGGVDGTLKAGEETIFVNAAWMTGRKREVEERNLPVVIKLNILLSTLGGTAPVDSGA